MNAVISGEAVKGADALREALMVLDGELSTERRLEISHNLSALMADDAVRHYVRGVLFARPLAADSDIEGALRVARAAEAKPLFEFWQDVRDSQPDIEAVWLAWEALDSALFSSPPERDELRDALVRAGHFAELVQAIHDNKVGLFFVNLTLKRDFARYKSVLMAWTNSFRNTTSRRVVTPDDDAEWAEYNERGHKEYIHVVYTRVEKQKAAIVEAMRAHNWPRVETFIADLVRDQMHNGGPEFVVKSLCDLSMDARSLGLYNLQVQLTEQSIKLNPNDVQVFNHHADALLSQGRLDEALAGYEQAATLFPHNVVARRGRAEVLKSLGRWDEALAAYGEVIAEFPPETFSYSGRAQVLKLQGHLDEALAAYEDTIRLFPDEPVGRTGRAEVFKSQGRLDEALDAYEHIIEQFPHNEFARNGRAEVLKLQGRLSEALAAFQDTIALVPQDVVPRNGRAEVLKAQGRLGAALAAYEDTIRLFPHDAIARAGRAEVLKTQGRLEESLAAYEQAVTFFPDNVVAQRGRAEVLRSLGRWDEALASYERIIKQFPHNQFATTGRAMVLVALRRPDDALYSLPAFEMNTLPAWASYHIRGLILLAEGQNDEAGELFQRGAAECLFLGQCAYFRLALAMVWLRQRRFAEVVVLLKDEKVPALHYTKGAMLAHAHGELHEQQKAQAAYNHMINLKGFRPLGFFDLMGELRQRYLDDATSQHDDEWVFEREFDLLMAQL